MGDVFTCSGCQFYKELNLSEGVCMFALPVQDLKSRYTSRVADAWVRPVVFSDDFCANFSEKKIVETKESTPKRARKRANALLSDEKFED